MIRTLTLFLAMMAGATGAAWATPPRVTMSDDRIVAATQTHLYVLRDIGDNLGSHWVELLDQHLIEIDLDTGEATRHWPLRRMKVVRLNDEGDFRLPGQVTERAGDTHDMMALLAELGAEPMAPSPWTTEEFALVSEDGALLQGDTQILTPYGIRKAARAQLAILRDAYPDHMTDEGWPSEEHIYFYSLYEEGDWLCDIRPEGREFYRTTDKVTVVKLHCEDAELAGIWSFHVLVKGKL